jgi:hypothetical protein
VNYVAVLYRAFFMFFNCLHHLGNSVVLSVAMHNDSMGDCLS